MDENKNSKIETTIKTMLYKQAKDKITKEEEELSYRKLHNLLEYNLKKENKPIPNGLSHATNYYYKKHKQNIKAAVEDALTAYKKLRFICGSQQKNKTEVDASKKPSQLDRQIDRQL